ncbi:hypothetical protein CYMTET_19461 [Cymbomonas tetramitiformis]|uniref:Uncharacterized protein n=1 Tax=Cymbomonas tetramitiformis TaxID=36881 RepID=A0AAE0G6H7_9CHLO|nr:hypothetical protein CYMTET_19461 [Cymbomonas tetramitiformis]
MVAALQQTTQMHQGFAADAAARSSSIEVSASIFADMVVRAQAFMALSRERRDEISLQQAQGTMVEWEEEAQAALLVEQPAGGDGTDLTASAFRSGRFLANVVIRAYVSAAVQHDQHAEADRLAREYVRIVVNTIHARNQHTTGTLGQPVTVRVGQVPCESRNRGRRSPAERGGNSPPRESPPSSPPPVEGRSDGHHQNNRVKAQEAEERLFYGLRKLRSQIDIYRCPSDRASAGEARAGHMIAPLKTLMRQLKQHFQENQAQRAMRSRKLDDDEKQPFLVTEKEELLRIIQERVEDSAQTMLRGRWATGDVQRTSDVIESLARACVSNAHLTILPHMLSRTPSAANWTQLEPLSLNDLPPRAD